MAEDKQTIDPALFDLDKEFERVTELKEQLYEYYANRFTSGSYAKARNAILAVGAIADLTREQREILKLKQ